MSSRNPSRLTRSLNDRLVIDLLLEHGPLDRPTLARLTGLSKPSVADLVGRLLESGLVEEIGEGPSTRRGPNAMLYGLTGGLAAVAGVELQPDHAQASIADVNGSELGAVNVPIRPDESPSELVARALRQAAEPSSIDIGDLTTAVVGTPGIVDPSGDMSFVWGQPEWTGGQLARMHDALGIPVRFENDINLAAIAERRLGRAVDAEAFALFKCDEGVGAAIMLGSQLVRGSHGAAGEIGYVPDLAWEQRSAGDYNEGLQSVAGARGLAAALADLGLADLSPAAVLAPGPDDTGPDGRDAVPAELRQRFLLEVARRLAFGVVSVCAVIDPELIVLVGEIATAGGDRLAEAVGSRVAQTSPFRPAVVVSGLGHDAVVSGAVTTALDSARDEIYGVAPVFVRSAPAIRRTP
ncbi:ROK family transcriptional regulator [Jiangella aurantiaca]|uniref:ROK family transcriptional regulator n=1 Tax=Jiangella aurantiaca TaxID=2530373 RepID=A0A4R5AGA4_9ACTN|nr:ROK family transcriptional regulator [Jiangella aurantiaca]TDD71643.1 ROK family transcriptional regulator [Jiangella aurantiaca]